MVVGLADTQGWFTIDRYTRCGGGTATVAIGRRDGEPETACATAAECGIGCTAIECTPTARPSIAVAGYWGNAW